MKQTIILGLVFLLLISSVSAVCTLEFDKEEYSQTETVSASMTCDSAAEKSQSYTVTWYNGTSGAVMETDTGTTPAIVGEYFFEDYVIPADWKIGDFINATLTGTSLEGEDFANVTSTPANSLVITNSTFGGGFLGLVGSIKAIVKDDLGKKISGGVCTISAWSNDRISVLLKQDTFMLDGDVKASDILTDSRFDENTQYAYKILCMCGSTGSATECIDEDGTAIQNHIGSAEGSFTTNSWLNVNTVVDSTEYIGREEMNICANLTNIEYTQRIPVNIYHQIRCSNGVDNNDDLDRILVASDDEQPDERGISVNTTQMQCKQFVVPEPHFMQGKSNECYASTSVWVLDNERNKIVGYTTSSPVFNITIDDINIDADWEVVNMEQLIFKTIINLSSPKYAHINAKDKGDIDIRLDKDYVESLKAEDQYFKYPTSLTSFLHVQDIKSINVTNITGDNVSYALEILDDGNLEIEVKNTDTSSTGYIEVYLVLDSIEKRQADALSNQSSILDNHSYSLNAQANALEDIANKTGTFEFVIEASNEATSPGILPVSLRTLVEEGTRVEGHFICYIENYKDETAVQWTKQVNNSKYYRTSIDLNVPEGLNGTQNVVCKIGETSISNLITTASLPFEIVDRISGAGGFGQGYADDSLMDRAKKLFEEPPKSLLILFALTLCFIAIASNNKNNKRKITITKDKEEKK